MLVGIVNKQTKTERERERKERGRVKKCMITCVCHGNTISITIWSDTERALLSLCKCMNAYAFVIVRFIYLLRLLCRTNVLRCVCPLCRVDIVHCSSN